MDYLVETFRPSDPLRQGDVLRSASDADVFGVLVTADCDIAHGKHGNDLTLVLAYSPSRYLTTWWSRVEYSRLRRQLHGRILTMANSAFSGRGESRVIDEEGLNSLIKFLEPAELAEKLGITTDVERERFLNLNARLRESDDLFSQNKVFDAVEKLSIANDLNIKQRRAAIASILDEKNGPADVFRLPSLPNLGHTALIVRLRSFISVSGADIASSTIMTASSSASFIRCARLADGVRFALIQKMAFLFSPIGMSEDYEADLKTRLVETEIDLIGQFLKGEEE